MSKRAACLALGTLALGWVVVSCSGDGDASFTDNGGTSAAGSKAGGNSAAGTAHTEGGSGQGGAGSAQGGAGGRAGSANGGSSSQAGNGNAAGVMGVAGSGADGGVPGAGGDATAGGAGGDAAGSAGVAGAAAGAGGEGAGGAPGGPDCESYKDCPTEGQYCQKATCDDAKGRCTDAPAHEPVCGCDGITYFDAGLAAAAEVELNGLGICSGADATACNSAGKCANDATCGKVLRSLLVCPLNDAGVCWVLPAQCPDGEPEPLGACQGVKCASLCEAVKSGEMFHSTVLCAGL